MWLAPFNTDLWAFVTVPPRHGHWVTSFVLHWTFLLEIGVWLGALGLYLTGRSKGHLRQDEP